MIYMIIIILIYQLNDQLLINNIEIDNLNEKLDNEFFAAFNIFKINYSSFEKIIILII